MNMEYQLDLFTYKFSYFDDYEWYSSDNGFRSFVGSINTSDFAVRSELKNQYSFNERGTFTVVASQQEDLRARLGLMSVGYAHHFGEHHRFGVQHMLGQAKSDLDVTLYYKYGNRETGVITAEVSALDWANNFVSDLAASRNSEPDLRHNYFKKPYLYTLRLESPQIGIFRGEAVSAFQPVSRAEVFQGYEPDQNFILNDWANYQAALLEVLFPGGSMGIIYQRTFTRMEREPAENSDYPLNFGNRQIQQRGGVYITYRWRGFGVEQWFWTERNRDQQFDENLDAFIAQEPQFTEEGRNPNHYPFNFNEIRRFNKTRIFYAPNGRLLSIFIEHNGDWRTPTLDGHPEVPARNYRNFYSNHIAARNEKLTLGFGFTFNSRSKLTLGASLDLDGDLKHGYGQERDNASYAVFDGGFGRFQIRW